MDDQPETLFRITRRSTLSTPNLSDGTYMNDGVRKVDFILVTKIDDNQTIRQEERRQFFEQNLKKEGVELETERINESNEVMLFVKVHLPWKVLCRYAEELQIKTPLWLHDKPVRKNPSDQMWWHRLWRRSSDTGSGSSGGERKTKLYGKNTVINWPFKRKRIERFAIREQSTFFTEKQRIEIAYEVLQQASNDPKDTKTRGIEALLEQGVYVTAYPLHDGDIDNNNVKLNSRSARQRLKETWASWKLIHHLQPLFDVRSYFGERIGFYFAFMDCYTRMLICPSIVGLLTFFIGLINASMNPELDAICKLPSSQNQSHGNSQLSEHVENTLHGPTINRTASPEDEYNVATLTMCPICRPPGCEAWEMIADGCTQYTWAFRLDNPCSFVLSAFVSMWAIVFLKVWKRREASLAAEWDTEDAEEHNLVIRPDYEERAPTQRRNPVTLENEPFVPLATKSLWLGASVMATVLCLLFACLCLIVLVLSRIALYGILKKIPGNISRNNVEFARWLIHGAIFVVVLILERVYHSIAHKLTAYECPRTQNQFMSSLLWKIFIFELLNDFVPIAYAAWIKGKTIRTPLNMDSLSELCDGGCMGEVTELVAVLLLARLVIGNLSEIGYPFLKNSWKRFRFTKDVENKSKVPQWLKDFHLNEVELDGVYDEYMEMMVQFAFIVLFIPALPVAAFVCFLNNIAEIRVDAINMLQAHRRPLPIRVSGIGIWNQFLDIITKSGIICNAALLAFTSDNIPRLYYSYTFNPGHGDLGFTKFSLSSIPVADWGQETASHMIENNQPICWYPDLRQNYFPFDLRDEYWQILSLRMVIFAAYCITFFVIMFLVNTFVSDVPSSVKTKIKRRIYVVTKSMEAEAAINQSKWVRVKESVWEDRLKD